MKILIKNGRVIDPSQGIDKKTDVLVEKGKIAKTGNCAADKETKVIDAAGKIVCPGFIDMHTHLREPGREDKETVETGLRAAVAGGFTTVCAMPNTEPACDTQSQALFLREKAAKLGTGTVIPVGAITKKREGKAISQMSELKDAGCLLVSDDGSGVQDAAVMRRAMEYAAMLGLVVSVHCEEKTLAENGVMNEGYWSTVLGLNGIPREAENIMIDRDIKLAELTKAKLHIAHVSTKEGVEMVRAAKKKGIAVTAEATPHHFTLTD
ncbi:MAG TPA: dihydroorotase, partial [Candidatus Omnitrophota bacterium]|nr:dihydroorotase [Candidatus Omnitrophota bacterium]